LFGGAGRDSLVGDDGNDFMYGGAGNDIFVFEAPDGLDFAYVGSGTDRIELAGSDWTLTLTHGSVRSDDGQTMNLSAEASGVITFHDGSSLTFEGIERIGH
jgi:hypothetical protein